MIRILHAADIHLDTSFAGRSPELRRRLREASREAFRRIVETAVTEQVHAVVIAGDLFDDARLSFETERALREGFGRLDEAGIRVVYATGNHDPGRSLSPERMRWPESVEVVTDGTPRRILVEDASGERIGWITAAGHHSSRETRNLAATFPEPVGDLPEIAVLHTQVVGSRSEGEHEPYAPSELRMLEAAGYDYWALGHVHLRQCLSDLPAIHYPGNVQGRTYRESGAKGVLIAEVRRDVAPDVRFVPLAPVRWETLHLRGLEGADSLDRIVRAVRDQWERQRRISPDPGTEWMLRVELEGGCPLWQELGREAEVEALAGELQHALEILDVRVVADRIHPVVDVAEHLERQDVLGFALRLVRSARAGDLHLDGLAGELAAGSLDGSELEAYLGDILEDAEGELLSRMRVDEDRP